MIVLRMVRFYPGMSRSLRRHRRRRKIKTGWILLVSVLFLLNIYLLFIKGLPGVDHSDPVQAPSGNSPTVRSTGAHTADTVRFISHGGEIRGVAGIRDWGTLEFEPGPHLSSLRFDMEEAQSISGQRTLDQWCSRSNGVISNGDTFALAMARSGLEKRQVFSLVRSLRGLLDFRRCRPGDRFEMLRSPTGRLEKFVYLESPLVSYKVERRDNHLVGNRVEEAAEVVVTPIAFQIKDSLYASVGRAGESPALVMAFVDIYAWDIDFYIDTHPGDTIKLLVEKVMANGAFVRYGRILAAEYNGDIGIRRAFWYQTSANKVDYYDESGDSLRKAFLKSPLKFTRVSSGFGMRVHPILGFSRKHLGVDLAAPRGTPIWAPGDGTVLFAGRKGISGNLVVLRHANGYETIFAHLHTIAEGVRRGARINQKQVIGTVGSTGRSTGPHLHFGMKKDGGHVNPFEQKFPPADPVPSASLPAYKASISELLERLNNIPDPPDPKTASVTVDRKDAG
jgi:murein DD-endopeptidase MepM/ murein hydrolase activator NlpD